MKRSAGQQGIVPSSRRHWLLCAVAAIPAMVMLPALPRLVHAQSDSSNGMYVLSSAARAKQIRQRVSSSLADKLRVLADGGLEREPHPRAVVHTQGLLPHEQDRNAGLLSQEDWRQTLTQALGWCVSRLRTVCGESSSVHGCVGAEFHRRSIR
jgi:hypothetical protein